MGLEKNSETPGLGEDGLVRKKNPDASMLDDARLRAHSKICGRLGRWGRKCTPCGAKSGAARRLRLKKKLLDYITVAGCA